MARSKRASKRQRRRLSPLERATAEAILEAMARSDCYRDRAARLLGRSESWLYKQIADLELSDEVRRLERRAGRRTWAPGRPAGPARRAHVST